MCTGTPAYPKIETNRQLETERQWQWQWGRQMWGSPRRFWPLIPIGRAQRPSQLGPNEITGRAGRSQELKRRTKEHKDKHAQSEQKENHPPAAGKKERKTETDRRGGRGSMRGTGGQLNTRHEREEDKVKEQSERQRVRKRWGWVLTPPGPLQDYSTLRPFGQTTKTGSQKDLVRHSGQIHNEQTQGTTRDEHSTAPHSPITLEEIEQIWILALFMLSQIISQV